MLNRLLESRTGPIAGAVALVCAVFLAALARGYIDHVPLYDELLHSLSARGLLASGEPVIADGLYERAFGFTWLVARSMALFGDSMIAARLPALASGLLLVALVGWWATRRWGLLAGLASGVLLGIVPTTLELAVFARFYTLHALVVAIIALAVFEALDAAHSRRYRSVLGVIAVALVPVALHLQDTTYIAMAGIASGAGVLIVLQNWSRLRGLLLARPLAWIVGLIVVMAIGLLVAQQLGFFERLRQAPLWAANSAGRPLFYLSESAARMPLLWPLLPVAIICAFWRDRRFAVFATTLLVVALAIHSIAAAKAMRYVYYVFPFCALIWGIGLASAIESASAAIARLLPAQRVSWAAPLALLVAGCVALNSTEGQLTARAAIGRAKPIEVLRYAVEAEWAPAVPTLQPLLQGSRTFITSNAMKAIHYLGDYDYELNRSIVLETDTAEDFGRDKRTGRRAIGSVEAVAQVLDQPGSALIVLENEKLHDPTGIPADALALIERRCVPVAVPVSTQISVWTCGRGAPAPSATG